MEVHRQQREVEGLPLLGQAGQLPAGNVEEELVLQTPVDPVVRRDQAPLPGGIDIKDTVIPVLLKIVPPARKAAV